MPRSSQGPAARRPLSLIALCGLPASGKSSLAGALAKVLDAAVLDKDRLRTALFAPADIEYSREQDDFCCDLLYQTATYLAAVGRHECLILDGRTFSRREQLEPVRSLARRLGASLHLVECTCGDDEARRRLEAEVSHPAANRTLALRDQLAATADPLPEPRLVLATDDGRAPAELARTCADWLNVQASRGDAIEPTHGL